MFNYLEEFDYKLHERYLTLERNIKAGSNSFYDAYLDMLEEFVRIVFESCDFPPKGRETCGDLLRRDDVASFFKDTIKLDEYTFNKMQDYTLKVNRHKHKQEKHIQVDTIVSYMKVFHTAISAYLNFKSIDTDEFDANYYINMFGLYERDNAILKNEMGALKEELSEAISRGKVKDSDVAKYKALLDDAKISQMSLEEQNEEMSRQISKLKDIKLSSLEEKLNKTIDLLNALTDSVVENRAISYAVGDTICGRDMFKGYVERLRGTSA